MVSRYPLQGGVLFGLGVVITADAVLRALVGDVIDPFNMITPIITLVSLVRTVK